MKKRKPHGTHTDRAILTLVTRSEHSELASRAKAKGMSLSGLVREIVRSDLSGKSTRKRA